MRGSIVLLLALLLSMTSPLFFWAGDGTAEAQPVWIEDTDARTRHSKTFVDASDPTHKALDISLAPVHYDGPDWKEVNTTIQPSAQSVPELGLARWEMVEADYEWFALQDFNTVPMVLYRNRSLPDSYVTFEPHLLQWTNDLDQIDSIAVPNTGVTSEVSASTITWPNGYGAGRDFRLTLGPGRMGKDLILQTPPPDPAQFILDGGGAALELVEFFSLPSGPNRPDVYVDGILWDEKTAIETFQEVEFRVGSETVFVFASPIARDALQESSSASTALSKSGNNLQVAVRVPYDWLTNATYPVTIDPTVDLQVGAGGDDWFVESDNDPFDNSGLDGYVGTWLPSSKTRMSGFRFSNVGVDQGATIDVAYFEPNMRNTANDDELDVLTNIYLEDADDPSAPTTGSDANGRVKTTAFTAWDAQDFANGFAQSPSIVSVVQEVVDREGWASGQHMQILWDDDGTTGDLNFYDVRTYDQDTTFGAKLHIEFTVGGPSNNDPVIFQTFTSREGGHNITYSEFFNATDPDTDQTLYWELNATNATFLSIASLNRSAYVNGTPAFADRDSSYYVNVTVGDAQSPNGTDFLNYTLYINNTLPSVTPVITTDEGEHNVSYSRDFDRTDANSDTGRWSLDSNATFLSVNSAGTVSGTPAFADRESTFWVNVTFTDYEGGQGGSDSVNYTLYVNNSAPTITNPTAVQEGGHNITHSYDFDFTDPNNDAGVWTLNTNASFLSVSSAGVVSGTPAFADRDASYYVNVTLEDYAGGLSDTVNYTLYINNTAPTITNPISDDTATLNVSYSHNFNHADANSDTPTWGVTTDAPFTLTISATGVVSGTPNATGTFWVNVTVVDYSGDGDFVNYTLLVQEEEVTTVPLSVEQIIMFVGVSFWLAFVVIGLVGRNAWVLSITGFWGVAFGIFLMSELAFWFGLFPMMFSVLFIYMGFWNPDLGQMQVEAG